MFGTVLIATQTQPEALVIPKKAIVRERDLNFVYVIKADNTVSRQEIEIGLSEENRVEVVTGLQEGDVIVSVGHETLNDGYLVAVRDWEGSIPESFQAAASASPQTPAQMAQRLEPRPETRGASGPGGGRGEFFQRLLQNPEIKKKYETRLAEDPSLATDPQKRRAFVREVMPQFRQAQGGQ
jgi:hypothetical protein